MGYLSSVAHSSLWTPPLSPLFGAMANHEEGRAEEHGVASSTCSEEEGNHVP